VVEGNIWLGAAEGRAELNFNWDSANLEHIARHQITAPEAEQVVQNDPFDIEEQLVDGEERFMQLGETDAGRILVVVAILRGSTIRVVTAWDAPLAQKRRYLLQKGFQHGFHP
jgi:uncharacterized DUF497 family protein